ncbi:zinc transporter ZIP1-like [Drosophila biarmipes]|uniref:zinc transporter ZIP1-like n=1 Tax=Drosophila biarmipes TaxID=125945 RepID=UPI001CDAD65E|nr:zinc transporter ZIP1-like [Drosophila biarmipes]XP_043951603.1 zinc transporter ZIP1-like [Drosophila biarmipes]
MNQTQVNNFLKCFLQIDEPAGHWTSRHGAEEHDDHDHDHDHDDEEEGSGLLVAKVTAMVVLFCASAICGSIPFLLNRCYRWTESQTNARSAIVVKCLLYFGGGVLLATTFLHLLPEVQEVVEELQECNIIGELTFPLAELLMCCGFFLMYFIEEAMHFYVHHHQKDEAGAAFERGHSIRNSHLLKPNSEGNTATASAPPLPLAGTAELGTLSVQNLLHSDLEQQKFASKPQSQANVHGHGHSHGHGHGHSHLPVIPEDASAGDMLASSLRGLFIVSALSLHELFEGMAIGLESSASSVWFMFGAVSAHKLVLAFCVGVELIVARTRMTLAVLYVLTFAVVSPLGIGIGILINHGQETTGPSLVSAILQGFACGTLIYVVFFEILSKNRSGLRAYLALFVGFLVMFGLQQLTSSGGHGHSHSHSSCSSSEDAHDHHETETRSGSGHVHDHEHDHDHPPHHNHAEELATVHQYEQQLQLLRQVTQKLLEAHPKKDA